MGLFGLFLALSLKCFGLIAAGTLFEEAEGPLDGVIEGGLPILEEEGGCGGLLISPQLKADLALLALVGGDGDVAALQVLEYLVGVFELIAPVIPVGLLEVGHTVGGGGGVHAFDAEPIVVQVHRVMCLACTLRVQSGGKKNAVLIWIRTAWITYYEMPQLDER